MNNLSSYTGQILEIELTSKKSMTGKLMEIGSDIIVLFNGQNYVYLPMMHILCVRKGDSTEDEFINPDSSPIQKNEDLISLKKILTNASEIFVEIFLSGNHTVYGYINQIQDDYIIFYSPAFKTIHIPIVHLKWLIPYINKTPYQIKACQSLSSSEGIFASTFKEQLKTFVGKIVTFDLGKDSQKIGKINNAENNLVELITGDGQIIYLNIAHLKSLHE
ncbi:DUF2642 domain-containing protein [Paenisporosarcina antarctica]|uniref:DUF2642 domain-containing protein n=1 Tax=Paenisporosarcina antarctica TaxID=417367 RepID=A0A4P7A2I4_9BACL|nr:DUF2642 domain-containing protein [Paenisporosarcina antarctica]QBP42854.1 DUF2642 domain-containing protein [Paenisporosarcina antarctica]